MKNLVLFLCGGAMAATTGLFASDVPSVAAPAASNEYDQVIHPGAADGSGFWNRNAMFFMYAPSFAFTNAPGAARYRFTVLDDLHVRRTFEAAEPTAALTPVWHEIPTGYVTVTCEGLDGAGRTTGRAGERTFWKAAGFREGSYPKAARGYRETALRVYEYIFNMKETQHLLRTGRPDPGYDLNLFVSKMFSALIGGMVRYAELAPEHRAEAFQIAHAAADYLLARSEPAGSPLAFFPPTYDGDGGDGKGEVKKVVVENRGQIALSYPASVAQAYLTLAEATGEKRYREAAERIGETYLRLQGADGTCALRLRTKDGSAVGPNRLLPISNIVPLFERLYKLTGREEYRAAADRAFASLERRLADWNWEGQFEDVRPTDRYVNLTKHDACSTAIFLAGRFPDDPVRRRQVREILRFAEDQFICWEPPFRNGRISPAFAGPFGSVSTDTWATPCVLEQYHCYVPIDSSAAKLIRTYLAAYRLEGRAEDLAKARALGDTATRMQFPDGRLPTWWWPERAKDAQQDWINCMMATASALLQLDGAIRGK